jgi:hypothetical protein
MSEHVRDVRAVIHAKKIRGITRNKHKCKDRYTDEDHRRDAEDARSAGIKIRDWKRR